jgi:hypothetical protein
MGSSTSRRPVSAESGGGEEKIGARVPVGLQGGSSLVL